MGDGTDGLLRSLTALDQRLADVLRHAGALTGDLDQLRALQVNGRIEAARTADSGGVQQLFETIGDQVRTARGEMGGFDEVVAVAQRDDRVVARVRADADADVDAVRERVASLAA